MTVGWLIEVVGSRPVLPMAGTGHCNSSYAWFALAVQNPMIFLSW